MDTIADDIADYPEFVPDLENYVSPCCTYLNADDLSPFVCSLSLSIFMLNIRSCMKNFNNFIANFFHCINSFSFIIFTETWLSEDRDKIFNIPGFYSCNLYRNHYGGGIKLYIKNCIRSKILDAFTVINNLCEILTVELLLNDCTFLLMMVYHPPTSSSAKNIEFVDFFTLYLKNLLELKLPLIVAGDMNLNLLNPNNLIYIDMYINNLFECDMRPLITKPTKVNPENPITRFSILDQIWISKDITSMQSFVLPVNITDHFPICTILSHLKTNLTTNMIKTRSFSVRGKETFHILLSNIQVLVNSECMNQIYENYHKQVFEAYNLSFPLMSRAIKSKQTAPWMSHKLKECIKKKAKLYRMFLRGRVTKAEYTEYKNRLTNIIRRVKALYYSKLFLDNANNSKMVWNTINDILKRKGSTELKEIAVNGMLLKGKSLVEYVNNYFVSIAASICAVIPDTIVFTCLAPPVLVSCFFQPASVEEVSRILKKLKNKGSKVLDIHPSIIKDNIINFSTHFAKLYNLSLVKFDFPDLLKIARVSPGYKSGKPDIIDNYRPISALPVFSKVFERLTLNRIESFVSRYNILTNCQFGFRKGCSTTQAVVRLVSLVIQSYHDKTYSACFFLDLKKAFDTVNHNFLIKKLEHYGFRGQCSSYMKSYYQNRKQYVYANGHSSSCKSVVYGVPQGSILGPICFSLYINDMPLAVKVEVVLFADDAAFIITCPTLDGLYRKVRELFTDLSSYLNMNKLVPNSKKCKLMMFKSRPVIDLPSLYFGGEEIEWVTEFKYLGITITNNMNFSNHINKVTTKISQITGTFTCLRSIVPRNILIKLYYALVFPHLSGHIIVWGSAPPSHLRCLTIRINNLLRTILGVTWDNGRPQMSTAQMFRELRILNLANIYKLNLYKFLRLLLDGELPEFWDLLLAKYIAPHAYNTRHIRFRHPNITCEIERRALSYQLIIMLEEMPQNILEMNLQSSLKQFKKILQENSTRESVMYFSSFYNVLYPVGYFINFLIF